MGIDSCSITVDNPNRVYYAGQTISGTVFINCTSPQKMKGIRLQLCGEANTSWTKTETYTDYEGKTQTRIVTLTGYEQYFQDSYKLFGLDGCDVILPGGNHKYNFIHKLRNEIPSSFEGSLGNIRYFIRVIVVRSWKFDQNFKFNFTVICPVDLNLKSYLKNECKVQNEKKFCCCFCTSGPLSLIAVVPVTGYVSEEKISIIVECDNASNVLVENVTVKLKKYLTYKVNTPSHERSSNSFTLIEMSMNEPVECLSSKIWQKEIDIPPVVASGLDYCGIIDLHYELKIQAIPKGIKIKIKGSAKTGWTESESYTDSEGKTRSENIVYSGHEDYFCNEFFLIGNSGSDITLPIGSHVYNFTHQLRKEIPSSFEGDWGHIRYSIKVTVVRSWKFDQHFKLCFTVIQPVDLNLNQMLKEQYKTGVDKTFCCCCCASAPVSLVTVVPVTGYVPGQKIPLTIEVDNASDVMINAVIVKLKKIITFIVHSPAYDYRGSENTIIEFPMGESVEPSSSKLWQKEVEIPSIAASDLDHCGIINLEYKLNVHAVPVGMHSDLVTNIPIIIGTIPLMSFFDNPPSYNEAVNNDLQDSKAILGGGAMGWNVVQPSQSDPYPNFPPPVFRPGLPSAPSIDEGDEEHTYAIGGNEFSPHYPTYFVKPSAPLNLY